MDTDDWCCRSLKNKNIKKVKDSIDMTVIDVYLSKNADVIDLT